MKIALLIVTIQWHEWLRKEENALKAGDPNITL